MKVIDLFPQFFRDKDRYPYISATGEVAQLVMSMYYSEVAESVKNLYDLDGSYYVDNINQISWKSKYAKDNIDKLVETFFPYAVGFLSSTSYTDKRGLLSFVDSFFSTKGTMEGLFSLFNFLNLPISVYTKEGEHGTVSSYNSGGEVKLEEISKDICVTKEERKKIETEVVYEYFPGEWEALVAGKSIILPNSDGKVEYNARIPSSYSNKAVDFVIDGFIRVEAGTSYSFLIGSDDGSYMEIGENGSIGKCWVPAEATTTSSRHRLDTEEPDGSRPNAHLTGKLQELASWDNPESWYTPSGYVSTFGHAFVWGSNWISWYAEEDAYIPIKIKKQVDGGGVFSFKLIGGKTQDVQAAVRPTCPIRKNGSEIEVPVSYNTLPRFPSSYFDDANSGWGTYVVPLNGNNGGDGFSGVVGAPPPSLACDYFDKGTLLKRKEKYIDPAGFLNDYDIVVSINLLDKNSIVDIEKANQESWKYYNKSLHKRIEDLVKEFTWICSDVIAYLYYAKKDVVLLQDKTGVEVTYLFKERTTDSSVRRMMLTVCEAADSFSVRRVKPPAGYSTKGSNTLLATSYLKEGAIKEGLGIHTSYDATLSNEETSKWVGVSSINGNNPNSTPNVSTDTQKLRVVIKPTQESLFKNNKPLVFAKGGVFAGKSGGWYEENTDVREWVTKNMYLAGTEVDDEKVAMEKYTLATANVADSRSFVLPNQNLLPDQPVVFVGTQSQYPPNIFITDKLKVTLKSYGVIVSPTYILFESGVDTATVDVSLKGATTSFVVTRKDTSWVSYKVNGNSITFTSSANNTIGERTTTAEIKDPNSEAKATITISQKATEVVVSPNRLTFEYKGGSKTVAVTTAEAVGENWTVSSNSDWLSADKTGKVTAKANTSTESRQGVLTYKGPSESSNARVVVDQEGAPVIRVSPDKASLTDEEDLIYYSYHH